MTAKYVNIISFDIPLPADYGGVIDVYYQLVLLHKAGVHIILHCFEYGTRKPVAALLDICDEVHYYKHNTHFYKHLHVLPYSVWSRKNKELIDNLCKNNYPILFEGLMSCFYLGNKSLKTRIKIYREANIEHQYYFQLAHASHSFRNKCFFYIEGIKLKIFQKQLVYANQLLALSITDQEYLKQHFPTHNVRFIPCPHQEKTFVLTNSLSDYILYHGNLAVSENENAAIYLCKKVFSQLNDIRCIIAGRQPSKRLIQEIKHYPNIELKSNLPQNEMDKLINEAQVHMLVTFQGTGLKLKLLNVLTSGKHIIANSLMLTGTGLNVLCHVADTTDKQITLCRELIKKPFDLKEMEQRQHILSNTFSNKHITEELLQALFQ